MDVDPVPESQQRSQAVTGAQAASLSTLASHSLPQDNISFFTKTEIIRPSGHNQEACMCIKTFHTSLTLGFFFFNVNKLIQVSLYLAPIRSHLCFEKPRQENHSLLELEGASEITWSNSVISQMRELTDSPQDTQLRHEKALLLSTQDPSHHATPLLWFWYILEYVGIHFGVGIYSSI